MWILFSLPMYLCHAYCVQICASLGTVKVSQIDIVTAFTDLILKRQISNTKPRKLLFNFNSDKFYKGKLACILLEDLALSLEKEKY